MVYLYKKRESITILHANISCLRNDFEDMKRMWSISQYACRPIIEQKIREVDKGDVLL